MLAKCYKCYRPIKTCYCKDIESFDPGIKFVFLMHPQEAYKQKTGTGRLASLSIIGSEIIIDDTFDNNTRTIELINNPDFYPMVLYPGDDASFTHSFDFKKNLEGKILLIFLIDATWTFARKMMSRSPSLQVLPKLSFSKKYRSNFIIKRQPADFCLSTIESSYFLIKELQDAGVCKKNIKPEGLINVFNKMVNLQRSHQLNYIERKKNANNRFTVN